MDEKIIRLRILLFHRGMISSWLWGVVALIGYMTPGHAATTAFKNIATASMTDFGTNIQQIVTGRVTDSTGVALVGVSVTQKDRPSFGTSTDLNGRYSIDVPEQSILVFSMVGYEPQELVAGNQGPLDVVLSPSSSMLDDV